MVDLVTAFDASASRYDRLTGLNPGYRGHLARAAAEVTRRLPTYRSTTSARSDEDQTQPVRIWDLGCGTGLSTRSLVASAPKSVIVAVDKSPGMLAAAALKSWPATVTFEVGALDEPSTVERMRRGGVPDGALAAYLFRNIPAAQRDGSLRAVHDALRPGGTLVIHDYAVRGSLRSLLVWTLVCWLVIIPLSTISGESPGLYTYLWRSAIANDTPAELTARLHRAGFDSVSTVPSRGWHRGVLHTFIAPKPD